MKQAKLWSDLEPEPDPKPDVVNSEFNFRYGNGQKLRDAFELIESTVSADVVTLQVDRDDGLHAQVVGDEHEVASTLDVPRESFEVLEGGGPATAELELLAKVLHRARKGDGVKAFTRNSELVVEYPESGRELSIPLRVQSREDFDASGLPDGNVTVEIQTRELAKTLRDLADLGAEKVALSQEGGAVSISQRLEDVDYKSRFREGDDSVKSLTVASPGNPIRSSYRLDCLKPAVSARFKTVALSFGESIPARLEYHLDDTGGRLSVIVAPAP